jgi:predicted TPR repeat methyltransferase
MHRQDDGTTAPAPLADRLHQAALAALQHHRPREALPSLDRLRRLPGQAGLAEALRAEALLALGLTAEADAAAADALQDSPGDTRRLVLRARAHWACGRPLAALDSAAAAVMAAPDNRAALLLFADLLLAEHRFGDAAAVLRDALRQQPEDPEVMLRLGFALSCDGQHAAAAAMLDRCAALKPGMPRLALAQAQAALARQDVGAAIDLARSGLARLGADAALSGTLGLALEAAGQHEEARRALQAAHRLAPDNADLAHRLAIAEGSSPERPPAEHVAALFDSAARHYEASVLGLGYRVPGLLREALGRQRPGLEGGAARLGPVLDLGCGTGLAGVALHDWLGDALVGVDLSRLMLEEARAKGIYTALLHQDLLPALQELDRRFDIILAADAFCYLGRLDAVLAACAARLAPGGLLLFDLERGTEGSGYVLHAEGRYAHAPDLLRADLAAAGLRLVALREEALRQGGQGPVAGLLVVAEAAA